MVELDNLAVLVTEGRIVSQLTSGGKLVANAMPAPSHHPFGTGLHGVQRVSSAAATGVQQAFSLQGPWIVVQMVVAPVTFVGDAVTAELLVNVTFAELAAAWTIDAWLDEAAKAEVDVELTVDTCAELLEVDETTADEAAVRPVLLEELELLLEETDVRTLLVELELLLLVLEAPRPCRISGASAALLELPLVDGTADRVVRSEERVVLSSVELLEDVVVNVVAFNVEFEF